MILNCTLLREGNQQSRMADITIFYSWQSDLASGDNRNFIQSCIDAAVKSLRDTVCIEADRDTKGAFGSPDIASTIFEKISQCDIFIADVSIINSEQYEKNENGEFIKIQKLSPNPNVLLELGYAAGVIGWDNIICIMNKDYGLPNQMPFDLEHRRLTCYSLKGKEKSEVRKELRNIISDTVMNVMENGVRPKNGMAAYQIGSFFESSVISDIRRFYPMESNYYIKLLDDNKEKCIKIIKKINSIPLPDTAEVDEESISLADRFTKPRTKRISQKDREFYGRLIKEYVGEDVENDFWNLGGLKVKSQLVEQKTEFIGTEEEKKKNSLLKELQYVLVEMNMMSCYWKTFDDYYIFPLAICNISFVCDSQISVFIRIENSSAEAIKVDRNFISPELKGVEGLIYEHANLKKVLMMPVNADIKYDEDISYNIDDNIANVRHYFNYSPFGRETAKYDESDYERELQKYFAEPMDDHDNEYEFYIKSLRPNEKSWLGPAIMIKPLKEEVVLSYSIKSNKTDGTISGVLKFKVQ